MDPQLLTVAFSIVASVVAFGGSWAVVRRYQKLGGGAAQEKLNATYRELNDAFEAQIVELKTKIVGLEAERHALQEEHRTLRAERLRLQQDIDDMRAEMRQLQKRATKAENAAKSVADRTTVLEGNGGHE